MERGKFGNLLILRVSMETLDEPVYPNIIIMFGDDGCGPGEQSLAPNVFFSKLFDVPQMSPNKDMHFMILCCEILSKLGMFEIS